MDVFLMVKKDCCRQKFVSKMLLHWQGIQFLCYIMLPIFDPFLLKIGQLLLIVTHKNKEYSSVQIITNFIFNLIFVFGLCFQKFLQPNSVKFLINKTLAQIIIFFKYILFLPVLEINLVFFSKTDIVYLQFFAVFNMVLVCFISFIEFYTNWSNHFIERDFCNKRENSIFSIILPLFLLPAQESIGILASSAILIGKSLMSLFNSWNKVQYSLVHKVSIFYALLYLYITTFIYFWNINKPEVPFQFLFYFISIGFIVSYFATLRIYKYINFKNFDLFNTFKFSEDDQEDGLLHDEKDNLSKGRQSIKQLFILSKILFSRSKKQNSFEQRLWWKSFNQIIMLHLSECENDNCYCKIKVAKWEQQVFIGQMIKLVSKRLSQNQKGVKIIMIYFYVEIARKPLKAYFEMMHLKKQKLSIRDTIDLQCLMDDTRECFDQIFLKNSVKNNSLPLLKVIDFQDLLEDLELKMRDIFEINITFFEIFLTSSVKVPQVISQSKKLFQKKDHINKILEHLVLDYPENISVQVLIYTYYQFIQVYRSREKQFQNFAQQKLIKKRIFEKSQVDIFKSIYGVIYIDLTQQKGKIQKITKNVCELFGYNFEDMISFNINQFMPRIFGKFHGRFLNNFIENGAIKILRDKNRFLFGKNKKKFIFPVLARVKTEHLFERQFGASALVRKLETHTNYMIIGQNGKIQEIDESLYNRFFMPALKGQVDRIRRLSIFKMLPELIRIISRPNFATQPQRIYQSEFIFTQKTNLAMNKFRTQIVNQKGDNNNYSSTLSNTEKSRSLSQNSNTQPNTSINVEANRVYCQQIYKNFLLDLQFHKLFNVVLQYRVSKLITNEFQLLQLQIVGVQQKQTDVKKIINQLKQISLFLNIYDAQGPIALNFQKHIKIVEKKQAEEELEDQKLKDVMIEKQQGGNSQSFKNNRTSQSLNLFDEEKNKNQQFIRGNSDTSSVTDKTQSQSKKQMLINAFNTGNLNFSKNFVLYFLLCFFVIGLFVWLVVTSVIGATKMKQYVYSQNSALNLSQVYEYRLAVQKIQTFYTLNSQNNSVYLPNSIQKRDLLTQLFTDEVKNLQNSENFNKYIQITDNILNTTNNITLAHLFDQIQFQFQNYNDTRSNTNLNINYQAIHFRFISLLEQSKKDHIQKSYEHRTRCIISLVIYQFFIILVSLISLPLYSEYHKRQTRIINLLSTMNVQEIKKARIRLKILLQNFRLSKFGNLKNCISNLSTSVEQIMQNHPEKVLQRNIKLTYEGNKNDLSLCFRLISIILFVIGFSLIAAVLQILYFSNLSKYVMMSNVMSESYRLQNKPPLLTNLYLHNINQLLTPDPVVKDFNHLLYTQAIKNYFQLTSYISKLSGQKSKFEEREQGITSNICEILSCQVQHEDNDLKLSYHVLDLKNKFDILSPSQLEIEEIGKGTSTVNWNVSNWIVENQMQETLSWVAVLFDFSQKWNLLLISTIQQQLQVSLTIIIILSYIFIPLYALLLGIICYKFIVLLNRIITNAEHIHMHFPVDVLSENTYLTSYFNEKIKSHK